MQMSRSGARVKLVGRRARDVNFSPWALFLGLCRISPTGLELFDHWVGYHLFRSDLRNFRSPSPLDLLILGFALRSL